MLHKMLLLSLILATATLALAAKPKSDDDNAHKINIKNLKYDPAKLTIKPGETVIWTNLDDNNHTITSDDTKGFASDDLGNGDTFRWTFKDKGKFSYHCKYHPRMKGLIVVAD